MISPPDLAAPGDVPTMPARDRLRSLDVLRGLAVIAMMMVDWTGSWDTRYQVFEHARWLGITLPDFIFPSLLFVMGVAIPLSLTDERLRTTPRGRIYVAILRRSALLFALGYLLNVFWDWQPGAALSGMRVMGVLQRYALVYPIAAALHLQLSTRRIWQLGAGLLVAYWALLVLVPVPGFGRPDLSLFPEGGTVTPNLATWIDSRVFGRRMGSFYPHDPEGLLTTLPAIGTAIIGLLAGRWLRQPVPAAEKLNRLFCWGVALAIAGFAWGLAFPLSKKLWTSSFVLYTGGRVLLVFAGLHAIIDVQRRARFAVAAFFGANALLAILLFTFIDNLLRVIPLGRRADQSVYGVKDFIFERLLQPALSPRNAAWIYSVLGIALLVPLFRWLHRRRLFLRV